MPHSISASLSKAVQKTPVTTVLRTGDTNDDSSEDRWQSSTADTNDDCWQSSAKDSDDDSSVDYWQSSTADKNGDCWQSSAEDSDDNSFGDCWPSSTEDTNEGSSVDYWLETVKHFCHLLQTICAERNSVSECCLTAEGMWIISLLSYVHHLFTDQEISKSCSLRVSHDLLPHGSAGERIIRLRWVYLA